MEGKILLFSKDPGGANTIIPLYGPLKEKGYKVRLFGKGVTLLKYESFGLKGIDILEHVQDAELTDIGDFLTKENPDFIITGTSSDDFTERYLWKSAEKLGIPTFAILDQWVNYGIRFSGYGIAQINQYNIDKKHPFLPTKILVMDEYAKQEMIKEGIKESRILISGHPYFEMLLKYKAGMTPVQVRGFRGSFNIPDSHFIITYASEPISKRYKEEDDSPHYWGYTERTMLKEILSALRQITDETGKEIIFIVRPHPKEDPGGCRDIIDAHKTDRLKIEVDNKSDSWKIMLISDLVLGLSSMFLIEAVILGKSVMSVQIGLHREDPFILSRRGILKTVRDKSALEKRLKSIVLDGKHESCSIKVNADAVRNVINHVEEYL